MLKTVPLCHSIQFDSTILLRGSAVSGGDFSVGGMKMVVTGDDDVSRTNPINRGFIVCY